ncbi:hypothetical protein TNCV_1310021 [Trichonephila clavipes]|nr:hypothetical protein TNCV_1310021 [Trichonephila clavipes]
MQGLQRMHVTPLAQRHEIGLKVYSHCPNWYVTRAAPAHIMAHIGCHEYESFYEHRTRRYAPDLRIGRRKCTNSRNIESQKVSLQRNSPNHCMLTNLHHNLCEYGSLRRSRQSVGRPRVTRTASMEQNVLDTVRRNLSTSVRDVIAAVEGT